MPGEGLSARHAVRRRNALSFTISFEIDSFPAYWIQKQPGLDERHDLRGLASMNHLVMADLQAGLEKIRQSPKDEGVQELHVRRPKVGSRELLQQARLDLIEGLV